MKHSSLPDLTPYQPALESIEQIIRSKFHSEAPRLSEISEYLLDLGGKRIRPILTLMTNELCGGTEHSQQLFEIAAGIELIHMATLLHDDIIDKSSIRRHQISPFARFGLQDTLLTGDFLLTRAFRLCARLDPFVIDQTEKACVALTEGEILELPLYSTKHTIDSSLLIAKKKTAALFRLSAVCGAFMAEQNQQTIEQLALFGENIGIAFQILDDILDVTSDEETLGKPIGIDITERKPSIVNLLWLESGSPLSKKLLEPPLDQEAEVLLREGAIKEILESDPIARAKEIALSYARQSQHALNSSLSTISSSNTTSYKSLQQLIDFTIHRLG